MKIVALAALPLNKPEVGGPGGQIAHLKVGRHKPQAGQGPCFLGRNLLVGV